MTRASAVKGSGGRGLRGLGPLGLVRLRLLRLPEGKNPASVPCGAHQPRSCLFS